MPITYAQPEPFSPSIASAYGAAQQFSQDAPTIAGLAEHTASLQQQGLGRADQLRFAYAQANAQAREQDANRYAQSEAHQADREQSGMNLGAQLEAQATGQMLHANTQLLAQQQGAQLQAWLGQQDLSQKEAMRLQQMQGAVADIQASSLPDDQKQASILQLKTGIDGYKQRLQAAQIRDTEAQATMRSAEAAKITKDAVQAEKFWSSSAQDRNTPVYDKRVLAQVAAEVEQMQADGRLGAMTPQERDQFIKDEVAQREGGLLGHEHRLGAGKSEFVPHSKTDDKSQELALKRYDIQKQHYDKEVDSAWRRLDAQEKDKKKENSDYVPKDRETLTTDAEADLAKKGINPPRPPVEPQKREAFGGRFKPPAPVTPTTPEGAVKEAGTTVVNQSLQELQARQDLSPEAKAHAATALQAAQELVRSAGGKVTDLNPDQKRQYDEFKKIYRDLPPPRQAQDPGERSRQAYQAAYSLAPGDSGAKATAGRMAYQKAFRGE